MANTKAYDKHYPQIVAALHDGETMVAALSATITTDLRSTSGTISGAIAATTERFMFSGSGMLQKDARSFPWIQVSSLNLQQGLLLAHITVTAATSAARFMVGKSADTQAFVAAAQEQMVRAKTASAGVAAAPSAPSTADELTKLAGLHAQGILTADEFAAAKARLLG